MLQEFFAFIWSTACFEARLNCLFTPSAADLDTPHAALLSHLPYAQALSEVSESIQQQILLL